MQLHHHLPLLVPLLLLLILLTLTSPSASSQHSECAPHSTTVTVSYPFLLPGSLRPDSCGLPDYALSCSPSNTLTLSISKKTYQVLSLDAPNRVLTLVDPAFLDQLCPQPSSANSALDLDPSLFRYTGDDRNITVFINCSSSSVSRPISSTFNITCSAGQNSYYRLNNDTADYRLNNDTEDVVLGGCVVSGVGGFLLACTIFFFCYKYKLKKKYSKSLTPSTAIVQDFSSSFSKKDSETISFHCQTPLFSYEELVEATNGFDRSKELGDGGYGTVYKGLLRDGRVVAVKRLYETSYKRVEQFMNEVGILSRVRHPNLVTLYGSTSPNSPHLLLVYEFIPNGTLADHLHNPVRPPLPPPLCRHRHRIRPLLPPLHRHHPPRRQNPQHPRRQQLQREGCRFRPLPPFPRQCHARVHRAPRNPRVPRPGVPQALSTYR
ncbi:uncharacterized protein A4U43_C01F32370 [Asparagus officinalis]|uniref:Protein kinase domain-containing protein n=1 Tax=Asparagus officinalis TaxID=4686 RepID=A0A5P1FW08_ASPOF|nr:uncharacterized protein A4U43_C01F32370 [Asparagus officinalis]